MATPTTASALTLYYVRTFAGRWTQIGRYPADDAGRRAAEAQAVTNEPGIAGCERDMVRDSSEMGFTSDQVTQTRNRRSRLASGKPA